MSAIRIFLLLAVVLFSSLFASDNDTLSAYQRFTGIGLTMPDGKPLILLRRFTRDSLPFYLAVNPDNLTTVVYPEANLTVRRETWDLLRRNYASTRYFQTLREAEANAAAQQDAGITRLSGTLPGIVLTVDLCPSQKPMDRVLFTELLTAFGKKERPVPISLSITGLWMKKHTEDFDWLLKLSGDNEIAITWINHTYRHRGGPDLPIGQNFLLEKGTNLDEEILRLEKMLLQKGVTPSVFFRFPGLVSDEKLFRAVTSYGLIPVGSDAWLGKNQYPKDGSIVLLHANGNEPIGIKRFLKLLREDTNMVKKSWILLDLREGMTEGSGK